MPNAAIDRRWQCVVVFHEGRFKLLVQSHYREIIENAPASIYVFLKKNSARYVFKCIYWQNNIIIHRYPLPLSVKTDSQ